MLSLSRFDLSAAALFVLGCALLFSIRYIGRANPQPTKGIPMTNAPEWVDPTPEDEAAPAPPPPTEREQLVGSITEANRLLKELTAQIRNQLLRLDEMGAPVSRSRTRASKLEEVREDWWAHFDYDVIKGMTKGTKDQQARAERYELS